MNSALQSVPSIEYGFNEMGYTNADTDTGAVIKVYSPPGTLKVFYYVLFSHGPDRIHSKGSNGNTFDARIKSSSLVSLRSFTLGVLFA